mgnify:CR=1 FL=1
MTISQALIKAYAKLLVPPINSAHLDAELLLSFVLGKPREYILVHPDLELSQSQILKFNKFIAQRAKNIPLAYLTHVKEFYGRPFYVDQRVLVPRPETEMMVEEVRSKKLEVRSNTAMVDVGTGSGCIIITLAKELENLKSKINPPAGGLKFIATDISKDALTLARKNARIHGVDKKIKFLHGNLLEPLFLKIKNYKIKNFIIIANLPYLTPAEIKQSSTIKHEPRLALAAGSNGLKYYRQLAVQLRQFNIKHPNIPVSLFCEIDPAQNKKIKKIFSFAKSVIIKKDLAGQNRIAVVEL